MKNDNDKRSARKLAAAAAEAKHTAALKALDDGKKANKVSMDAAIGACKAAGYAEA